MAEEIEEAGREGARESGTEINEDPGATPDETMIDHRDGIGISSTRGGVVEEDSAEVAEIGMEDLGVDKAEEESAQRVQALLLRRRNPRQI